MDEGLRGDGIVRAAKSKPIAYALAVVLGPFGIHHFYLRHYIRGALYLLFCWTYVPCILAWLLDMWFIGRWVDQCNKAIQVEQTLNGEDHSEPNAAPTSLPERPPADMRVDDVRVYKYALFYDEESVILPEYAHLKTPERILKEVESLRLQLGIKTTATSFFLDSIKFSGSPGKVCEPVGLKKYYTTFEDLNWQQLKWYLYWRGLVLRGTYLPTDLSYIILFAYELINYSFNPQASFNVSMLVRLHDNYRDVEPRSSRYLSSWIADMLLELNERELAEKWRAQEPERSADAELYRYLQDHAGRLAELSIRTWKPFIASCQTKFAESHRNEIYRVFKQAVGILEAYYEEKGSDLLQDWFQVHPIQEQHYLFSGAVMARETGSVTITRQQVKFTTKMAQQLTQLWRLAENFVREKEGARHLTIVHQEVFPKGFELVLHERLQMSQGAKGRFVRIVTSGTVPELQKGSPIPAPPNEEQSLPEREAVVIDFDRLRQLQEEYDALQMEFKNLSEDDEPVDGAAQTRESSPSDELQPMNPPGSPDSNDEVLLDGEMAFLRLFADRVEVPASEVHAFMKDHGTLPGAFIDALNEKLRVMTGDALIQRRGDHYYLGEDDKLFVHRLVKGDL